MKLDNLVCYRTGSQQEMDHEFTKIVLSLWADGQDGMVATLDGMKTTEAYLVEKGMLPT